MSQQDHEDPQTPYEVMLDQRGLDCAAYGCWNPIGCFVEVAAGTGDGRGADNELGLCLECAKRRGHTITRYLES